MSSIKKPFKKIHNHLVIISPITIIPIFHITCITIINYFIVFGKHDNILRSIYFYYNVVEINDCNMLYLYCIL